MNLDIELARVQKLMDGGKVFDAGVALGRVMERVDSEHRDLKAKIGLCQVMMARANRGWNDETHTD